MSMRKCYMYGMATGIFTDRSYYVSLADLFGPSSPFASSIVYWPVLMTEEPKILLDQFETNI